MPTSSLPPSAPAQEHGEAGAHYNMGNVLQRQGLLAEAVASYRRALLLRPDYAEACNNMGVALLALGQADAAAESLRRAILLNPGHVSAHNNLGNALLAIGKPDAAATCYQTALQLRPAYAEARNNLGNALLALGQTDAATECYRAALTLNPDYAEAHYNLGNALHSMGQEDAAMACYQNALTLNPDYADARNNLALLFNARGNAQMALGTIAQSLQNREDETAKEIFVACASRLSCQQDDAELRKWVTRALTESWGRPGDLARIATDLIKAGHDFGPCIARASHAWPTMLSAPELFAPDGMIPDASGTLLEALLVSTCVTDIMLERFLTMARRVLLEAALSDAAALGFHSALARQCFINEYIFYCGDEEMLKAGELRNALAAVLENDGPLSATALLAVAAYFPLHTIPKAGRLLQRPWPEAVRAVLVQQISEPEEERRLTATIAQITAIEDGVSRMVQKQYEENPYPRWVKSAPAGKVESVTGYLRHRFPDVAIGQSFTAEHTDVLIAGCGTGQQSLETARKFRGARVLAVDLSLSSLAYAKRKTEEQGGAAIEYAQADLLKLGALDRRFDLIESVGVLHHLAQPFAGWRVLLSLLRPGGFMRLGFYSELARRHIVRAQAYIAEQGYGSSASEIRRCRQDLLNSGKAQDFGGALTTADFFSISSCRDLLFHVQEQRLTLTALDGFMRDNHLRFLGFEIESDVVKAYRTRFPDDPAATNLAQWQIFENENPDTFFGMYQFWVQRGA